jgi:hypothetical protein
MKGYLFSTIAIVLSVLSLSGQEFDLTFVTAESGTQTHFARNSITLGPGYEYTPGGGSLTVEIQNPVVTGFTYYTPTPVDPETRTLNTSYLVGATPGVFNVNPAGAATYSIPLSLLPGVNGLSPSLSLVYSSSNGLGIVGFGWQLGGVSMITRGLQTYYHDGAARGIELDLNDRFYIDGQRLVNTTSYDYGSSSAKYQTDNDIFTRVTPQGVNSYGPAWFKAETKSGLIIEYGNSNGSKQMITGYSQIVAWNVSKIKDLFGNEINFNYLQDGLSVYPAEITYGPNTITFYYSIRHENNSKYLKGVQIKQALLLDKVVIKYNSTVVKTYELKYDKFLYANYSSAFSVLNEIIEYGAGTSRFNSTAIKYLSSSSLTYSLTTNNTTHQYVNYSSRLVTGDFDGNGRIDFLCLPDASKGAT